MIATHQFGCTAPGCRAYVRVDMTSHDDQEIDVEKLGAAFGFCRVVDDQQLTQVFAWRCQVHSTEAL